MSSTAGKPGSKRETVWNEFLFDSVCAGTLGGCAVALFFLVVDVLDGRPLFTPAMLGDAMLRGVAVEAGLQDRIYAIAYFSLVHITAFVALGAALTWLVHEVELHSQHPAVVLLVIFLILELGFFLATPLLLPGVIRTLGVARVFGANLLAAGTMALYFVLRHRSGAWHHVKLTAPDFLFDAGYAGALGGSAVGLFFLVVDLVNGDPLFTPSLMGSVLFLGIPAAEVEGVQLEVVAWFTAVHMSAFVALGAAITWVVHEVELHSRHPSVVLIVLFALIEASFLALASLALPGVIERVGIGAVAGANLLAALAITIFFVWSHQPGRRAAEEIVEEPGVGQGERL